MTLLVLTMLAHSSNNIGCGEGNYFITSGCNTAIFVDFLTRLAILCSAFLPRVVFVKTVE